MIDKIKDHETDHEECVIGDLELSCTRYGEGDAMFSLYMRDKAIEESVVFNHKEFKKVQAAIDKFMAKQTN